VQAAITGASDGKDLDFLNDKSLLEGLTIRARAAYYLAVAESVFAAAPPDDRGLEIARQAMNKAWQWIEGASVEADELDGYLENEDTGLQFFIKSNTCVAVSAALSYVIWRAYQAEGAKYTPQTMNEVTEEMIVALHGFAEQTSRFDHQLARRLLSYLRTNYMTSKIDDLGAPILRRDIASGANIEILKKSG
jgi:hypothetical protein